MNIDSRNELVESNLKLVGHVLSRYFATDCKKGRAEDLFQAGCLGLIEAAERFDSRKGVKFSTFACNYVWGWIMRYKQNCEQRVHVPEKMKLTREEEEAIRVVGEESLMLYIADDRVDVEGEVVGRIYSEQVIEQTLNLIRSNRRREIVREWVNSGFCATKAARSLGISAQRVRQCAEDFKEKFAL